MRVCERASDAVQLERADIATVGAIRGEVPCAASIRHRSRVDHAWNDLGSVRHSGVPHALRDEDEHEVEDEHEAATKSLGRVGFSQLMIVPFDTGLRKGERCGPT